MALVDVLRYLPAHIRQAQGEILIHGEKTAVLQQSHRMADTWFGNAQVPGHIYGAYHSFFFLEYQDGLQIVLA